ncbi:hypothetical protein DRJ22_04085 [Candidatus Woesearchaeota archaeon]|nr:MAG: hypothetical protein DRJ22_04085 [Candidatus Woesearchaeota archaeon]
MARRGRPVGSVIRQNIVEILNVFGSAYGYQIHRFYNELFPSCTREVIYYNLRKGVALGEFRLVDVKVEKGTFSWGVVAEKKYYVLGPNAQPRGDSRVEKFFHELKKLKNA